MCENEENSLSEQLMTLDFIIIRAFSLLVFVYAMMVLVILYDSKVVQNGSNA